MDSDDLFYSRGLDVWNDVHHNKQSELASEEVREKEAKAFTHMIPGVGEVLYATEGDWTRAGVQLGTDLLMLGSVGLSKAVGARAAAASAAGKSAIVVSESAKAAEFTETARAATTTAESAKAAEGVTKTAQAAKAAEEEAAVAKAVKKAPKKKAEAALKTEGADKVVVKRGKAWRRAKVATDVVGTVASIGLPVVGWTRAENCPDGFEHEGTEAFGEGLLASLAIGGIECATPVLPDEPIAPNGPLERKDTEWNDDLERKDTEWNDDLELPVTALQVTTEYPILPVAALLATAAIVSARA